MTKIHVLDNEISIYTLNDEDYICITDIARYKDPDNTDDLIRNWIRNRNTIEFLGIWERLNNPDFKPVEFDGFRKLAGLNSFTLTPKQWIEKTSAIGLISKPGRYGGTYAHKDIAYELSLIHISEPQKRRHRSDSLVRPLYPFLWELLGYGGSLNQNNGQALVTNPKKKVVFDLFILSHVSFWGCSSRRVSGPPPHKRAGKTPKFFSRDAGTSSSVAYHGTAVMAGGCQPVPSRMPGTADGSGPRSRHMTSNPCPAGGIGSQLAIFAGSVGCVAWR